MLTDATVTSWNRSEVILKTVWIKSKTNVNKDVVGDRILMITRMRMYL